MDNQKFFSYVSQNHDATSYYHLPIFQFVELDDFVTATNEHLRQGRSEEVGKIFKKIAERHSESKEWEEEKCWFIKLRKALEHRAANHSRLATAQLGQFFKWYWRFVEPEDGLS